MEANIPGVGFILSDKSFITNGVIHRLKWVIDNYIPNCDSGQGKNVRPPVLPPPPFINIPKEILPEEISEVEELPEELVEGNDS